jgi:hypothetical protein
MKLSAFRITKKTYFSFNRGSVGVPIREYKGLFFHDLPEMFLGNKHMQYFVCDLKG